MSEIPDEGDGLARLGLSPDANSGAATDNSRPAGAPTARAKGPWWAAGRSLGWSIASGVIWLALFIFRLVAILTGGPAHGLDFVLLIGSGMLAVWWWALAAYLVRTRR